MAAGFPFADRQGAASGVECDFSILKVGASFRVRAVLSSMSNATLAQELHGGPGMFTARTALDTASGHDNGVRVPTITESDLGSLLTHELAARLVREIVVALGPDARVMPLKGTLIARAYYPAVWQRPMSDCDVLVLGISFRDTRSRLARAGYQIVEWSRMVGGATVRSPTLRGLALDLHARPLPVGLGAVNAAWLATGARTDVSLFGTPVLVPDPRRLLVHLLGNILKDHVYRAFPHAVQDVARVLDAREFTLGEFAATVREARLRRGAWMALAYVAERTESPLAAELQTILALSRVEMRAARARLASLRTWTAIEPPPWYARVLARAVGDRSFDVACGLSAAVAGTLLAKARNRRIGQAR